MTIDEPTESEEQMEKAFPDDSDEQAKYWQDFWDEKEINMSIDGPTWPEKSAFEEEFLTLEAAKEVYNSHAAIIRTSDFFLKELQDHPNDYENSELSKRRTERERWLSTIFMTGVSVGRVLNEAERIQSENDH